MSNTPLNGNNLPRIAIAGAVLAVVGIGLFLLLWVLMGSMGVSSLPRLIVSLCIPPAIIAAIIGVYILVTRSRQ
ncbi:MAG: hypothetical protein IAE80_12695 [Anaerolinea sp.]|nr:hypothetical protein [Anaerolinea sp.]